MTQDNAGDDRESEAETASELDADTAAILARRRSFVARALGRIAIAGTAVSLATCAPCLTPILDGGVSDVPNSDAQPQPCLRFAPLDARSQSDDASDTGPGDGGVDQ